MADFMLHLLKMNEEKKMKENRKANNLLLGAIYINNRTGESCRLVAIWPCEGVWLENAEGIGYGELIPFEDVSYADKDEVQDFLDDLNIYRNSTLIKN